MRGVQRSLSGVAGLLFVLVVLGCGGGSGGGGQGDPGGGGPPPPPPPDVMEKSTAPAQAQIPAGFTGSTEGWTYRTGAGDAAANVAGLTDVPVFTTGVQFTFLLDGDGDPVLLGFLPPEKGAPPPHVLSARTTAEALVWLYISGFAAPTEVQAEFLRALRTAPEVDALAAAVEAALVANPKALTAADAAFSESLQQTVAAVQATTGGSKVLGKVDVPVYEQSGITILETGFNQIQIQNRYRRRLMAFVYRDSYVDEHEVQHEAPETLYSNVEISPTNGVNSLFSLVAQIASALGDWANAQLPYAPVHSRPLDVPLTPASARSTWYRVAVVGPGQIHSLQRMMTLEEGTAHYAVTLRSLVFDFLVPIVSSWVLPGGSDGLRMFLAQADSIDQLALQTMTSFLGTYSPDGASTPITDAITQGDVLEAARLCFTALISDDNFRNAFFLGIGALIFNNLGLGVGASVDQWRSFVGTVNRLNFSTQLTITDSIAQALFVAASRGLEEFEVYTRKSRIGLTPGRTALAHAIGRQTFTVSLLEEDVPNAPLITYRWSTTGTCGTLRDDTDAQHSGTSFDSSADHVEYVVRDPAVYGLDTVTVEAVVHQNGTETSLGTAHATIEVKDWRPEIRPHRVSLRPGNRRDFVVAMPNGFHPDGHVYYNWTTSGRRGYIQQLADQPESSVTYRCLPDAEEGEDTVTVDVWQYIGTEHQHLGTDTAEIEITDERPTVIYGTGRGEVWQKVEGNWCSGGSGFYTVHPKVEGAIRYDVHCYGFNDTAYYGTERYYTIYPATAEEFDGEYKMGWFGGAWFGPCSPGYTQDQADADAQTWAGDITNSWRIAGIIVEVTVIYPPE